MRHPARLTRLALLLAVAAPALSAAAEVRDVEILLDPELPTWREEVTVTVRGEADCAIAAVHPTLGFSEILLDLEEVCSLVPPSFQPFEVSATLGTLEPHRHVVRVRRPEAPHVFLAERELRVHEVADLVIAPPATPPVEGEPFTFTVSAFSANCGPLSDPEVVGDVIRLFFFDDCAIVPSPGVADHEVAIGPLPAGDYEVRVFRHPTPTFEWRSVKKATIRVHDGDLCTPGATTLCLGGDRFRVEVGWRDFFGGTGAGQAVPLRDDTGLFWFFDDANVELTVKVLAACPVDGHHWVFIASGSTVGYTVTVTDTLTDESRTYENALGEVPELIADTAAFPCP